MDVEDVVEGNKTFQKLRFPGYFTSLQVGKPQLPVISELVGIPDVVNVKASIIDSEVTTLKGYRVYPFQEPVFEGEKKAFIIDDAFYHEDSFYPEFDVKLSTPTIWRDIRVVRLKIFPVKFNPATGELKVFHRMIVKLEYYGVSDGDELYAPKRVISPTWERIYKNKILNFDFLNLKKGSKGFEKTGTTNDSNDYEYLIICNDEFISKIKPLAYWKTRKGIRTRIDSLSVVGTIETDIKNHITNEYNNNNIDYVLLVGDEADLTMSSTGPGDYWYSNLSGDIKPEIAIGRISAINLNEVEHIVSKILAYELDRP